MLCSLDWPQVEDAPCWDYRHVPLEWSVGGKCIILRVSNFCFVVFVLHSSCLDFETRSLGIAQAGFKPVIFLPLPLKYFEITGINCYAIF